MSKDNILFDEKIMEARKSLLRARDALLIAMDEDVAGPMVVSLYQAVLEIHQYMKHHDLAKE